jgi:predicted Zn-dependent peptidase
MDHLDRATLEDVDRFFKTFYVPDNATLVVVGDFDPAEVKGMIWKYFNSIPKGEQPIPRLTVVEDPQQGEEREVVPDNVQLPGVFVAYRIPEEGHPDFYPLVVTSSILSVGESSRLYRGLVYEKKVAQDVEAATVAMQDPGLFLLTATALDGCVAETLEEEIEGEIDALRTHAVSAKELEKVKNQLESSFTLGKQRVDQKADLLAHFTALRGDPNQLNRELERYLQVTADDITRVAQRYFTGTCRTVLHYIPQN